MLKTKQKKAIELLADGCSRAEAARRLGIKFSTLNGWKQKNEQFRRALADADRNAFPELENLKHECLLAAMRELNKRLGLENIQEMDVKTLLTIMDRVGKCTFTPPRTVCGEFRQSAAQSETDVSVSHSEEPLLELLNDDIRKELYELLVRHLDAAEEDSSS